ncbi:MAG: aldose 1-epimerase [Thermoplasmata archaeon YP2-bin.285]|uniref:Aldose 1-epimerase n=2 Tax=Candidatus Sysuiplasma superficiale TaxID=2823368 RepID=A0A8J7YT46_9ARCH|nr:aldose 1-epimerase [Candidatus Sysuiplasma superficiale]
MKIISGDSYALVEPRGAYVRKLVIGGRDILKETQDGKETHGGACNLIPYAGRVRNATYTFDGRVYLLPVNSGSNSIHGFAKDRVFKLEEGDSACMLRALSQISDRGYPSELRTEITMRIGERRFEVAYEITNTGAQRAPVVIGSHPYFLTGERWRLIHSSEIERLNTDSEGIPDGTLQRVDYNHLRDMSGMTFDECYSGGGLISLVSDETVIRIQRNGMNFFVLYNGRYCSGSSVAVEPMTGAPDAFNNRIGLNILEPGQSMECSFLIEVGDSGEQT